MFVGLFTNDGFSSPIAVLLFQNPCTTGFTEKKGPPEEKNHFGVSLLEAATGRFTVLLILQRDKLFTASKGFYFIGA